MVLANGLHGDRLSLESEPFPALSPEQLKASIVSSIAERLEVFSALAVLDQSAQLRQVYAERIVTAVLALSKGTALVAREQEGRT